MPEENIKSESIRRSLVKSMARLDKHIRPSGYETDQDWLFVITMLTASGYLRANDRDTILRR